MMKPGRYNISNLKKALGEPKLIQQEGMRLLTRPYLTYQKQIFERKHGEGQNLFEKDWDYMLILDACRYDVFLDVNWIKGETNSIVSKGSHSEEFANKSIKNRTFYDTVYVTANGYGAKIGQKSFHDMTFTEKAENSYWASREGLHPESVYDSTLDAYHNYPNKRIVAHFMQPHSPYFGEKAAELRERLSREGVNDLGSSQWEEGPNLKNAVQQGLISLSEFKEVYKENLEFVLGYIEDLCDILEGKIVITADHGELLGDQNGLWRHSDFNRRTPDGIPVGHPKHVYVPELRKVPYHIIPSESRPNIDSEEPTESINISDQKVEDRLTALGYK